ncbi:restriction endonuclease subunit S [Micromonospora saelicesensis]|uniref:Type I restriction enzyme, S subunit n=1 Tax=Micromonospora saelicesensis TaxID=285676 RepID=A0A1C4WF33_9ACTN|nr:restriction endonuclease subunit S [Micromonospora saelicesensis]SCE94792.1 type I restriction enzyme, S subunit [Micromonospora saelicesensis]
MTDWSKVALRRVSRVVNGGTPTPDESNWGGDFPWATPVDIGAARGRISATQRTLTAAGVASGSRIIPANSILVSTRAPIGYVAITSAPMAFNQGCRGLVPTDQVDARFLYHHLTSSADELSRRGQGTTFLELSAEGLAGVEVHLPPLEEQQRIADFLDAETARIDRLIDLKIGQVGLLEARKRSAVSELSEHLISRFGAIELRYVMSGIEQGWSPQCEERLAGPNEWGVIKAGCVNGGRFNEEQHKTLPADVMPRIQYRLRSGDLLMSRASGSVELIGSVAVVPDHVGKMLLCDKVYRLRVDARRGSAEFLAFMLRSHANRERIKLGISGAEGMANNLPTAVVKGCVVPAAPLDVQERSVVELQHDLSAIEELQRLITGQVSVLAERKQALITAAVTGQLDVTTARRADLS